MGKKQIGPLFLVVVLGVAFGILVMQERGADSIEKLAEGKTPEQALYAIAGVFGAEDAFAYLKETYGDKQPEAHDLAHIIGYIAYEQKGENGFAVCDSSFAFGCYHGLLSLLLAEHGRQGISAAQEGCNALATRGGVVSCVHGIGHGILVWKSYDLASALEACDTLQEHERSYCYDGVFMENATALMNDDGAYLQTVLAKQQEDAHWPCSEVAERYRNACYYQQPSALLGRVLDSIAEVEKVCADAGSEELSNRCVQGIGVRVGQLANGDPDRAVAFCAELASEHRERTCIVHSAVEFTFQGQEHKKADAICSSLPADWEAVCQKRIAETRADYGQDRYEEIQQILATNSMSERARLYRNLLARVGAEEAQEALYRSGLPFTGETHLVNHEAGYFLYDSEGIKGIVKCKDYFLASCYHGFLIEALADEGAGAFALVMDACNKVGKHVAVQCAHGIGHGLLAQVGYKELPEALALCDQVGAQTDDFPFFNCYDGVFMENNYSVHLGYPSPDKWIDENDPFYPCDSPAIQETYRKACWSNQPQMMLEVFHRDFARLGELCGQVENAEYQKTCFNSIARHMHSFTDGNPDIAFGMCALLGQERSADCVSDIAVSDFSVGGRVMPYQICGRMEEGKDACYAKLFGAFEAYRKALDPGEQCLNIEDAQWEKACLEKFSE